MMALACLVVGPAIGITGATLVGLGLVLRPASGEDWRLSHARHVWELERELGIEPSSVLGIDPEVDAPRPPTISQVAYGGGTLPAGPSHIFARHGQILHVDQLVNGHSEASSMVRNRETGALLTRAEAEMQERSYGAR